MKRKIMTLLTIMVAAGMVMSGCGSSAGTKESKSVSDLNENTKEDDSEDSKSGSKIEVKDENLLLAEEACEKMFLEWMENQWDYEEQDNICSSLTTVEKALQCVKVNGIDVEDGVIEGDFGFICSMKTYDMLSIIDAMTGVDDSEIEEWYAKNDIGKFIEENKERIYDTLNKDTEEADNDEEVKANLVQYLKDAGVSDHFIENRKLSETNCIQFFDPIGYGVLYVGIKYSENLQGFYCPIDDEEKAAILVSGKIDTKAEKVDIEAKYINVSEIYQVSQDVRDMYSIRLGSKEMHDKVNVSSIQSIINSIDDFELNAGTVYIQRDRDYDKGEYVFKVSGNTGSEEIIKNSLENSGQDIRTISAYNDAKKIVKVVLESKNGNIEISTIEYVSEDEVN